MRFYFTIDVDWIPGSDAGLVSLLEFCRQRDLPTTLFVSGKFAETYPEVLRDAARDNCDIGSHGWLHGVDPSEDFRKCSLDAQREWIRLSTEAIETATEIRPIMFRAPNLSVSENTARALIEHDYRLDSSVPARRYDFGYGACSYARYFRAPLVPYTPSASHLGRIGDLPLLEVAPSAYACIPLNMSALRVFGFGPVAWAVRRLAKVTPVLNFYVHPSEFVAADKQQIPADDPKRYQEGLGPENLEIVERFINYVKSLGYVPGKLSDELQ